MNKVSVLIPVFNEELNIKRCILSIFNQSRRPDEIIVVNDGSTDNSQKILESFGDKITLINLSKNSGNKSRAQEFGLLRVTGDILITTDADTILDEYFVEEILKEFENKDVVAAAGYVKSVEHNWLTACRQIDYLLSQDIHKEAQSIISALFVIPGCAAAYKTEVFRNFISFDHDTLTEDLDFTYKFHRSKLKIAYSKSAIVYTQDPSTIKDYIKQLRRWNGGNWQNLLKHFSVLNNPNNALELSLVYLEGLIFPFLLLFALVFNFSVFLLFSSTYLAIISFFTILGARRDSRFDILAMIPIYYFISFLNYAIFVEQFFQEVVLRKHNLVWFQPERRGYLG